MNGANLGAFLAHEDSKSVYVNLGSWTLRFDFWPHLLRKWKYKN
jgi:hypothetical protein